MPRTVLRQFTGGISNEIDAQNLRDDQGEEAVDINLKGFALEPGEGLNPLTDSGHYYYRGEWIKDSEAVSFEESGVGVVKTYDTKRPQFEEIINDKDNVSRNLGPALPPGAVITGTIVSEGTRGERPGHGAHLLELPSDKLGSVDTYDPTTSPPQTITDSPSLEEHKATSTQDVDHVYYYAGQPYWVEKTGGTWNVKTRAYVNGKFTSNDITSANLTRNSGGSFFKENYFICWDAQYIETVALSNTSMSINSLDTLDTTQGGNQGSNLGFGAASNVHVSATAKEISSVDICNGVISFTQKVELADRKAYNIAGHESATNYSITEYTNSSNERWILPRLKDSYIVLLRDGYAYKDGGTVFSGGNAESSGAYNAGSDDVEVHTDGKNRGGSWITPTDNINRGGWSGSPSYFNIGLKYIVVALPAHRWGMVKQLGANKPEILVVECNSGTSNPAGVTVTRSFSESGLKTIRTRVKVTDFVYGSTTFYRMNFHIHMRFPNVKGSIYWTGSPIRESYKYWTDFTHGEDKREHGRTLCTHFREFNRFRTTAMTFVHPHAYQDQTMSQTTATGGSWSRKVMAETYTVKKEKPKIFGRPGGLSFGPGFSGVPFNDPNDQPLTVDEAAGEGYTLEIKTTPGLEVQRQPIVILTAGLRNNTIDAPSAYHPFGYLYSGNVPFVNTNIRLCSYTPGGSLTLQTHASQTSIHTHATIAEADKSISFDQATTTNFTPGDYIRVSGGHTALDQIPGKRRIAFNLPHDAAKNRVRDYFVARIAKIEANKLMLVAIPGSEDRFMLGVDEECYPLITTIDNHLKERDKPNDPVIPNQKRELIRTALATNTLLGSSHGRRWDHIGENESIEVRNNVGAPNTSSDYAHKISWDGRTIRAVNTSGGDPRIIYIDGSFLKSQNGIDSDVIPFSSEFSDKGTVHLTSTLMTVVDKGGVTVYDPFFNAQFVKARPEKQTGLGLTGDILDGFHVSNGYGIFVFVKSTSPDGKNYWKMVKTGNKPETTLLSYDFVKPLEFDGVYAWGIFKDGSGNYDIHTTVPFYESSLEGSWMNHSSNNNGNSAWGQVEKTRISKADKDGNIKRWLSVDWKYDSGVWNSTGDPVIGLQHEANKMVGAENEFTWYILDAPSTLEYDGQGTVIEEPKLAIKFNSKITRDVVFFKTTETVLPVSGQTGAENQVSFTNYEIGAQKFYVLNDNIISLNGQDPEEQGYQMAQADTTEDAFDASRVGRSAFLVGAPNMYNPYGPNIDFYYRASFIDKWNNESVPSPLPTAGIEPLDSADDCIQMNLSPEFFRFDNEDITKIRIYRYGGDSSEFVFLRDIPIPKITSFPVGIPASGTGFAATFARKSSLSSFYNLKTYYNISELSDLTNSAFDLTATPSDIDGSWRVNQVYEAETPTVAYTTTLSEDLNATDTTVKLINASNPSAWPASGVIKLGTEYISYSAISTNDLTGCVRGYYETTASEHKAGRIQSIAITGAGTNYGFDDGSGGFTSDYINATSFTDASGNIQLNATGHGMANGTAIILKTTGNLPAGLNLTSVYFVVSTATNSLELATTSGGTSIAVTGTDLGDGTPSYNGCIITGSSIVKTFTATEDPGDSYLDINTTTHGLSQDDIVQFSSSGTLPTGLSINTNYYVLTFGSADIFRISTTLGGDEIPWTNAGSGTHSWEYGEVVGSGFYATYGVNTSTGAITSVTIGNPGTGYLIAPTLAVVSDPGAAVAGSGATFTITRDLGGIATPVEWVLEMQHRNQDTTTLTVAIETNVVPSIIYVENTDVFPSSGSLLIGNQIIDFTGKGTDGLSFTGCTHNTGGGIKTTHSVSVTVFSYDENYTVTSLTNVALEINAFGYRDKARTPVMSLHSMKEDNWPPLAMTYNEEKKQFFETESTDDFFRYVTAVGSMYFGAVDADLRFSRYGSPEYWPLEAVVTLDSEIKGIMEHAGEGIIFTTNSVYRVRGTDPKSMVAFRVPDAKGIKDGDRHSISEFNGGIIWKTAGDGICMYSAGRVSYLTRDKHNIPDMDKPYSCVADGVYWLFQRPRVNREAGDTGNGFRLEITTGDLRLCQTSIQAYYAYFAKALGKAVVVTSDNSLSTDDTEFIVQEIGGKKASNISWKSKKIDAGDPAIAKAFGSVALVYESLESQTSPTLIDGIRGEALAVSLLGLGEDDLDAGDLDPSALDGASDLYDVFTRYDSVGQEFVADIGGTNWDSTQRKTILMPIGFDTSSVNVGDSIWNELFADNTKVESVGEEYVGDISLAVSASDGSSDLLFTDTDHTLLDGDIVQFTATTTLPGNIVANTNYYVNDKTSTTFKVETVVDGGNVQYSSTAGSGVSYAKKILYPTIVLDNEPLRSGTGNIIWGNLPEVHLYINNESTPSRSFTLPPIISEEPQSTDLYLDDLRRFRTISIGIEGNLKINTISLRHFPIQQFQSQTLHHSADIFYKGIVDFRVKLDGELIYRKELSNAGTEFTEERVYLPASSFGTRVHYMNESRSGMIESVTFNGSLAA